MISGKHLVIPFLVLALFAQNALAHHAAVVFDRGKSIQRSGKVTQYIWRNPHLIIGLEVTNDDGETELWKIEGQAITALRQAGFDREAVHVGDEITVMMAPMKNGKPGGLVQGIIAADGKSYAMDRSKEPPARERLQYPALMAWVPPPEGETWQMREKKTRPPALPIVSKGMAAGDGSVTGRSSGALDPDNLARERPPAAFDLTGVWQYRAEDEWRANYGSFEFKPSPEFTAKGKAFHDAYIEAATKGERYGDPTAVCYPPGMPRLMTRYGSLMMMQYPTAIFMLSRLNNEYRVIYLDGRDRAPENLLDRNWGGESLGHWDGDTLVIETTGFTDENHLIQAGVKTGSQLKIVERYQLVNDGNTLVMDFTFTDPEYWVGEWKHIKFRDRVLRSDVREANCISTDNFSLPGID